MTDFRRQIFNIANLLEVSWIVFEVETLQKNLEKKKWTNSSEFNSKKKKKIMAGCDWKEAEGKGRIFRVALEETPI